MIFLKIYCMFCIVIFLLMEICIYEGIQKIKRKYADKIEEKKDKAKANVLETLCVHIRIQSNHHNSISTSCQENLNMEF